MLLPLLLLGGLRLPAARSLAPLLFASFLITLRLRLRLRFGFGYRAAGEQMRAQGEILGFLHQISGELRQHRAPIVLRLPARSLRVLGGEGSLDDGEFPRRLFEVVTDFLPALARERLGF